MGKRGKQGGKSAPVERPWDESGGIADGGLAIVDQDDQLLHIAPARVAISLRYFLARLQLDGHRGIPGRLGFTSALSGEGVSFVARSVAAVIAHDTGQRVCLVDLNWWSTARRSDPETEPMLGLSEVVRLDKSLDDVLVPTVSPNLWLLPAGDAPVSVRPALARDERVAGVLAELEGRFDHLVLDLPAVLATSDALALARLCDGYALVVRQGVTTRAQIRAALAELRKVPTFGVVLNRVQLNVPRVFRRLLGF